MPVTFDPSALAAMKAKMATITEKTRAKSASAVYIEASLIMTNAKQNFVPVDLGTLRNSGTVDKPVIANDGTISIKLYFGGAAAPYALAIHEHPSDYDPPSWKGKPILNFRGKQGRGPKYLEYPLRQAEDGMAERLAARIRK